MFQKFEYLFKLNLRYVILVSQCVVRSKNIYIKFPY